MKTAVRTDYVHRNNLLKLLSDDEIAKVSSAESDGHLAEGSEYIDLQQLGLGVQRVQGSTAPVGQLLPKKAVREVTWSTVLSYLAAPSAMESSAR
jgi:hypothetical protein